LEGSLIAASGRGAHPKRLGRLVWQMIYCYQNYLWKKTVYFAARLGH
jgi:hypothetical protein